MSNSALRPDHLDWAVGVLRPDAGEGEPAVEVRGLRDGGAPWHICVGRSSDGTTASGVLRVAEASSTPDETDDRERLGMQLARRAGIPVPRVLGAHRAGDFVLLLVEHVEGSSALPPRPDQQRLRALGAVSARIHAQVDIDAAELAHLPPVEHPIPLVDFAALRAKAQPEPLLLQAERRLAETAVDDPLGFVHGDLWSGNTLWRGDSLSAVLDWDCCGRGAAGVDLGSLRCDAAMCYSGDTPDEVLAGWEAAAGRRADSVAYWDVVAALSTPPDISWFAPAISGMTQRPDLTAAVLRERRDAFLADALHRLR